MKSNYILPKKLTQPILDWILVEENRTKYTLDTMTDKLVNIFNKLKDQIAKPMKIKLPKLETL